MNLKYTIWQAYQYLLLFIQNENRIVYELEVFSERSIILKSELDKIVENVNLI